jgi:hypothetical protein
MITAIEKQMIKSGHEFTMRRPAARWLLSRGYSPVLECQSLRNCDLVGVKFEQHPIRLVEMISLELKRKDVAGVLSQCRSHLHFATETWAGLPLAIGRRNAEKFASIGIGVLGFDGDAVCVVVSAARHEGRDLSRWKSFWRRRNEYISRLEHPLMFGCATLHSRKMREIEKQLETCPAGG